MNVKDLEQMNSYSWWHRITFSDGTITPGICPHGTGSDIETRFGIPRSFENKTILDIGTYDGLFAFECEKRGAEVYAIDIYQNCAGQKSKDKFISNKPFEFVKKQLNSKVQFNFSSLEDYTNTRLFNWPEKFDYILYYGVLYHIKNPLEAVENLMKLIKSGGTILVETAISYNDNELAVLEYRPNHEGDATNYFYPSEEWIKIAFLTNGAKSIETIYKDPARATFRIKT